MQYIAKNHTFRDQLHQWLYLTIDDYSNLHRLYDWILESGVCSEKWQRLYKVFTSADVVSTTSSTLDFTLQMQLKNVESETVKVIGSLGLALVVPRRRISNLPLEIQTQIRNNLESGNVYRGQYVVGLSDNTLVVNAYQFVPAECSTIPETKKFLDEHEIGYDLKYIIRTYSPKSKPKRTPLNPWLRW